MESGRRRTHPTMEGTLPMAGLWESKPPAHAKETPKENAERQMREQKGGKKATTAPRDRRKPTRPDPSRWFPF